MIAHHYAMLYRVTTIKWWSGYLPLDRRMRAWKVHYQLLDGMVVEKLWCCCLRINKTWHPDYHRYCLLLDVPIKNSRGAPDIDRDILSWGYLTSIPQPPLACLTVTPEIAFHIMCIQSWFQTLERQDILFRIWLLPYCCLVWTLNGMTPNKQMFE